MAKFDVYKNNNPASKETIPFLLDVQTDLLDDLATRVVIPLISAATMGKPAGQLNPKFTITKKAVILSTAELAGVPVSALGEKVRSLKTRRDEIIGAVDFLLTGF